MLYWMDKKCFAEPKSLHTALRSDPMNQKVNVGFC